MFNCACGQIFVHPLSVCTVSIRSFTTPLFPESKREILSWKINIWVNIENDVEQYKN